MRARRGLDGLDLHEAPRVEDGDDARRADGHVEQRTDAGVPHDIRHSAERQPPRHARGSRRVIDDDDVAAIGRAEEATVDESKTMRTIAPDLDATALLARRGVDPHDDRRGLDVREDRVRSGVVDRPARTAGEGDRGHDPRLVDGDDRRGAALAGRLAEIERVDAAALPVIREPVRPRADADARERSLVGTPVQAHACGAAVGRGEEIVLAVDEHSGHAGQATDRPEVGVARAIDDVDGIHRGVRDVEAAAALVQERIRVIEAFSRAPGERDGSGRAKGHPFVLLRQ